MCFMHTTIMHDLSDSNIVDIDDALLKNKMSR